MTRLGGFQERFLQVVGEGDILSAQEMMALGELPQAPSDRILLALGFTFSHEAIDVIIVGTKTPKYMRSNLEMVETQLPIPEETVAELHRRFEAVGQEWPQLG